MVVVLLWQQKVDQMYKSESNEICIEIYYVPYISRALALCVDEREQDRVVAKQVVR